MFGLFWSVQPAGTLDLTSPFGLKRELPVNPLKVKPLAKDLSVQGISSWFAYLSDGPPGVPLDH